MCQQQIDSLLCLRINWSPSQAPKFHSFPIRIYKTRWNPTCGRLTPNTFIAIRLLCLSSLNSSCRWSVHSRLLTVPNVFRRQRRRRLNSAILNSAIEIRRLFYGDNKCRVNSVKLNVIVVRYVFATMNVYQNTDDYWEKNRSVNKAPNCFVVDRRALSLCRSLKPILDYFRGHRPLP